MKKILAILAVAATMFAVNAQAQNAKSVAAAKAALDKAQAAAENPKQNTKTATWLKYGQTLLDAYNAPAGNVWVGMSAQELQVLSGGEKPRSESQVTVNGQPMLKQEFSNKNIYFNQAGQVAIVEVTRPVVENALGKALDAYKKAAELDPKGTKTKDIKTAIESIASKYNDEAYNAYTMGDMAAEDLNRAKGLFEKCLGYNYFGDSGEVFAKLADITDKLGDKAGAMNYLNQGRAKFPGSQTIIIGLINEYMAAGDNDQVFALLREAQKNEPNNSSLFYVEGETLAKMGREEEALAAYDKASAVNPAYEYGYIGKGKYLYDKAVEIQDKANAESDDAKYMALMAEFEKSLKGCIEPFEKAFEVTKDPGIKGAVAEYLKNACFRFRTESADFQAKYDKYNSFLAGQ